MWNLGTGTLVRGFGFPITCFARANAVGIDPSEELLGQRMAQGSLAVISSPQEMVKLTGSGRYNPAYDLCGDESRGGRLGEGEEEACCCYVWAEGQKVQGQGCSLGHVWRTKEFEERLERLVEEGRLSCRQCSETGSRLPYISVDALIEHRVFL